MASGLPDYYRGMRTTYGVARRLADNVLLTALGSKTLLDVPGKGVIYGGVVYLEANASQGAAVVELHIDNWQMSDTSFANLNKWGFVKPNTTIIYLTRYNEIEHLYSVAITPGTSFEERLKVVYDERDGGTPTVYFDIIYALI